MDAILSLLGLDFYRDKAVTLEDAYIDGPDGQQRRYRKIPRQVDEKRLDLMVNK